MRITRFDTARPRWRSLAAAALLAATLAACAMGAASTEGSGGSMPGGIDYHSGPYRMQNG